MRKLDLDLGNTYIVGDLLVPRAYDPSGSGSNHFEITKESLHLWRMPEMVEKVYHRTKIQQQQELTK